LWQLLRLAETKAKGVLAFKGQIRYPVERGLVKLAVYRRFYR
jgi:hypothetical protein